MWRMLGIYEFFENIVLSGWFFKCKIVVLSFKVIYGYFLGFGFFVFVVFDISSIFFIEVVEER